MGPQAGNQPFELNLLRPYIEVAFSTSPGPGGQNVNKVHTRVILLLDFEACPAVSPPTKARIRHRLATRISRDGRLRVTSSKERSQSRNRAAAEEKVLELLAYAAHTQRLRKRTSPTHGSQRRRLEQKRRRGEVKSGRSRPMPE
jgi:ribosome-associated protein